MALSELEKITVQVHPPFFFQLTTPCNAGTLPKSKLYMYCSIEWRHCQCTKHPTVYMRVYLFSHFQYPVSPVCATKYCQGSVMHHCRWQNSYVFGFMAMSTLHKVFMTNVSYMAKPFREPCMIWQASFNSPSKLNLTSVTSEGKATISVLHHRNETDLNGRYGGFVPATSGRYASSGVFFK